MMSKRAFTMVELMAVMVIVLSLAAFLFPTLTSAKMSAKTRVCADNLRQLGMAVQLYTADHDDGYPQSINEMQRLISIYNYGLGNRSPDDYPSHPEVLREYMAPDASWICPLDTGRPENPTMMPTMHLLNAGTSYLAADLLDGQTTTSWECPSEQVYASDGLADWHSPANPSFRQLKSNSVFYDGHVEFGHDHMHPTYRPDLCRE